ncbi:MAG: ABC transporter permease [Deltaproteobacteria bacterium]|nr:ABC transporter permease [Deltaproteobacteria bacterium]
MSIDALEQTKPVPVTHIRPLRGWIPINFRELWEYRDLLWLLAWKDIRVRYKQTVLGAAWAVLQPLLTMAVFSLFFGRLAKVPSDGLPYPIFTFAALVPWTFFSFTLTQSSNSLVGNPNLIKKVYFPRLVVPMSCSISALVDMGFAFLVLCAFMAGYGMAPTLNILWLPALILLALVTALGAGLWFAALSVRYRDVRYIVPFLVQFWLFATPIAYPSSLLSRPWQTVYALNPMVGVVDGFRWALLGSGSAPGPVLAVSALAALMLLFTGALYFRRMEATFADIV